LAIRRSFVEREPVGRSSVGDAQMEEKKEDTEEYFYSKAQRANEEEQKLAQARAEVSPNLNR